MKSKHILILFISLCIAGMSADLFANSFAETFGFSAEGIARGNAMAAVVDDWSSLWYNVAGLGKTQGITRRGAGGEVTLKIREEGGEAAKKEVYANQVAIGYLLTVPKLSLKIPQRYFGAYPSYYPVPTNAADKKPYGFITYGGALDLKMLFPIPDIISSARLGFAMSVNQDFSFLKVSSLDPREHNFLRYGRGIQRALILSGIGLGFLNDAFGIGGGVNFNFHGKGKLDVQLLLTVLGVNPPQYPVTRTSLSLNIVPGPTAGAYFSPGKLIKALEGLDIGASYRYETVFKQSPFDANNLVRLGVIHLGVFYLMEIMDYYSPHTVNGGIAYTRWDVTLSAEVGWEMWSRAHLRKDLKAGFVGVPRYRDIPVYKAGIKYDTPLTWLSVMMGYSYVPSILPSNAESRLGMKLQHYLAGQPIGGMYNYLDNDKHLASAGFTVTMPKPTKPGRRNGLLYLTCTYQFQYLVPRSATKLGNLQAVGTNAWYDSYLYNPGYRYGGMNHSIAVEVGTKL